MCGESGFSEGNCSAQLSEGTDVRRGRLSWILFKVLLYDDLVTSHPVIGLRELHGSVFYTSEVIAD